MKKYMVVIVFSILLNCIPIYAVAGTLYTSTCSQVDVNKAIQNSNDGDTVIIPAGSCTWVAPISFCKSITLQGSGDSTTINVNIGTSWGNNAIIVDSCSNKNIRITNFKMVRVQTAPEGLIVFGGGSGTSFRIDHMNFSGGGRALFTRGEIYGVMDHSILNNIGLLISEKSNPDGAWTKAMGWENSNAVYIEDSTLHADSEVDYDCESGGKVVYRYNTIEGSAPSNHGFDSTPRGCMQLDVYNNKINQYGSYNFTGIQYRGGTGVIYNNIITGTFSGGPIYLENYRSIPGWAPDLYNWGVCNGTNPLDGNADSSGYPCKDQIGRGPNQNLYPIYEWNNCKVAGCVNGDSNDINISVRGLGSETKHIVNGRDYYNNTKMPAYVAYTYPHPLTSSSTSSTLIPVPPNIIQISP